MLSGCSEVSKFDIKVDYGGSVLGLLPLGAPGATYLSRAGDAPVEGDVRSEGLVATHVAVQADLDGVAHDIPRREGEGRLRTPDRRAPPVVAGRPGHVKEAAGPVARALCRARAEVFVE